ncbi:SDR family NAD(P)-dependent oxidoreductase [Litoribacillus peritrichatus]|uniref:SDR family NAD(P)-dependent oxidoreductase n=1 Tax=Litoribacillus peritrichatus TaxID=718191 RepID=A0ABP7MC24_9GAMM
MKNLTNKVAVITGAASGIGQALALALAKEGCHLALSDLDSDGLKATKEQLNQYPITVTTAIVNVADKEAMHQWASQVAKDHKKIHLVFNNAGVAMGGTVAETTYEDYQWILDINLWGVVYGTKAFLPYLKQTGESAHIINISSVFGLFSQPTQSGYNMSKFAVRGFTESLRQELDLDEGRVSATCVHPGGIKTNIARNAKMAKSIENLTGDASAEQMRNKFESFFLTTPEQAAQAILHGVKKNKRRVLIGPDARVLDIMQRLLPGKYQTLVCQSFKWASA